MTSGRQQQIEDLYRSASQQPAGQRGTFLAAACGVDLDLKAEVENLLAKDELSSRAPHLPADDASSAPTLAPPHNETSQMGPYRIEGLLGAGGMGKVYRATDTRLDRKVAVKISAEYFSGRFEREARAISALNHPNICTLYDVGPNFLVMELLDGSTLAGVIQQGPLPPEQVLRYGAQIASALAEAHACGIVHRDLKPGNIMVTRHGVKVLDFGLAKMISQAGLTETRAFMGTPVYMAPEQVEGGRPTLVRTCSR